MGRTRPRSDDRQKQESRGTLLPLAPVSSDGSFETFYAREFKPAVRLAAMILGDVETAEDVAQDAFANVLRHWQNVGTPESYLRTTIVNRCRDLMRRGRVRGSRYEMPQEQRDDPDELWDVLAQLRPKHRLVVVLHYYEGLTLDQIATMLNIREGTVRSRLSRSLGQLRKELRW